MAMTDTEATAEALLLAMRKLRRLHPAAYADVTGRLPEGARYALTMAENSADKRRDTAGPASPADWPMPADETEGA